MTTRIIETSPLSQARVTGLLYLSLLPLAIFGTLYVPARLVVPGDVAATVSSILASESLFRLGIVSALLVQVINVVVVLLLYQLLKPVNKNMAALMVIFLLLGVPIAMLNELSQLAILLVLKSADHLTAFTPGQWRSVVPLVVDLHALGLSIAKIFWGLWLLPMGYLVFKSGFLPRILGILLMIGCAGYLLESFAALLLPNLTINVALFTFWGEVLFPLWLLIKGVNVKQWENRALIAASA